MLSLLERTITGQSLPKATVRTEIAEARSDAVPAGDDGDLARWFAERGTRILYPQGRTILVENEPAEAIYLVLRGIVRESTMLPDGRRHIVDFLGCGEMFGLSESDRHPHLVEAETDVACLRLPIRTIDRMVGEGGAFAHVMMRLAGRRLSKSHRKLVAMGCLCSLERTAHFLAWVADSSASWRMVTTEGRVSKTAEQPAQAPEVIQLPMTRREIADYLGLTLETVCRAITRLKDLGLVEMTAQSSFRIPDREALDAFILADRH